MILECTLNFEAAHRNTSPHATERTRRLHGHSYEIVVAVEGPIDPQIGWVMDFAEIKDRAMSVIDRLDHRILNDIAGVVDSTQSDMTRWLTEHLRIAIPLFHHCMINILGDDGWTPRMARLGDNLERLSFGFAAAHHLPRLPESHKCRRVHGHSFHVAVTSTEVHRLAESLRGVYDRLDHQLLNEIPGLENPTSELLAQWLAGELERERAPFEEIMVAETCTAACRLRPNPS